MICDVYDNVVEPHIAELIDMSMKELYWKYDYKSSEKGINKHWHLLCGYESIFPNYDFIQSIWDTAKTKYKFEEKYNISMFKRVYCNAHTFGIEPHVHKDDGDFTMIYYPILDWKPEWLGGTVIWNDEETEINKYVNYIGNRLFVFDSQLSHQAMPVSRQCYRLRTCIVFKTWKRGYENNSNNERLDFYGKN